MCNNALSHKSLIAHQLSPALMLDRSGIIVSTNEGAVRLIFPQHQDSPPSTNSSLLGKSLVDLGIVLLPGKSPVFWTWDEVLNAARGRIESHDSVMRDGGDVSSVAHTIIHQDTEEFWDHEAERQSIVESDIYVTRHTLKQVGHGTNESPIRPHMIRARANVRWLPSSSEGHYLVTFCRTSLPQRSTAVTPKSRTASVGGGGSTIAKLPDPASFFASCFPEDLGSTFSLEMKDLMPDASNIASSIVPYIVSTLDTDGQVYHLTDSWYHLTGLSESESLGSGWASAVHPEDVPAMTVAWADVLRNERSDWTYPARVRRASDGTYCWFLIRTQPHRDDSGKLLRWYASMIDIHEWVIARLEADRQRQSILTLFSQTDVMLWGIDKSNHIYICEGRLDWDPTRIVALLDRLQQGKTSKTAPIDNAAPCPDPDADKELILTIQAVLEGRAFTPTVEHWEGDRYFRTRFVAERTVPFYDAATGRENSVQAALALTFDITEENARVTLQKENERLVTNEKAAVDASTLKSRFLANMSHEIRTPISGIIGLSEHLSDCGLTEEQTEFCSSIRESAKFLLTVINDVLDFSKLESGHMDVESIPFAPNKLISDTIIPLRLQAEERGIALNWTYKGPSEEVLHGDPWRVRQIITNLISNSLKFTQEGRIDLTVQPIDIKGNQLLVEFIVLDTGIGITEEAMKCLFKPFTQADNSTARLYGGTGLGLSICRQLLELMGGQITLKSIRGQGTTATCRIPFRKFDGPPGDMVMSTSLPARAMRQDPAKIKPNTAPHPQHASLEGSKYERLVSLQENKSPADYHILLVEDNLVNRKVIALAVKKLGYAVSTACNGQEALDYLCKTSVQPRPDAVLMDCMMPVVDGYEATRKLRSDSDMFDEEVRTLPIIALTASAIKGDKEKCWEAGMDDYLTKPAAREDLMRMLLKWIAPQEHQN
ncbi:hypothetical protein P153DRAFT_434081 [Dothidotthia symphoricarpi CBS 119687]|uniref:Uncharacterized protein n=1 Tax=Dothidotthia symphoricarpi CBS 119687 TaxID=1392245 RepID=A0A6A6A190_9PLEO|nr:uncharacterized protein P153DRAFT_434081 [Dothidotthia symphoricarpi CBS 119687]KAF2125609.1 hypothetical protein P153DRAFT_434081 [Dothidotthia symphoricarpi CBS 119687]